MVISWQIHREKKSYRSPSEWDLKILGPKYMNPSLQWLSFTHHFSIQCFLCQSAEDRFWHYSGWVISSFHCCQEGEEKIHTSLPSTDPCEDHFLSPGTSVPILRALLCRFSLVKRKKTTENILSPLHLCVYVATWEQTWVTLSTQLSLL